MSTSTAPRSVYPDLEPLLIRAKGPVQYIGSEVNSIQKTWDEVDVHWVLSYPDAYEVGQPNQGIAILYEVLNNTDWIAAERSFTVWPDLATEMRAAGVPQFTLESHFPVRSCDIWGFSIATELGYTNVLEMLDLAGVPLLSAERGETDPLIVAGGHCMVNPEPMADFLDVVVIGDGEEAVLQLSEVVRAWLRNGCPGGRAGILDQLAATGSFYVPSRYAVTYRADHQIERVQPRRGGIPATVRRHVLTNLDAWPYPAHPIVPIAETVHERYSIEIFRGCTRGCRFCQAGMITRPVRERSAAVIEDMATCGLAATGYEELGLLSLSSADHSQIAELSTELADRYAGTATSLSLPSTRVDAFNLTLAAELARNGRRTGLTFAPEGGTERIRDVINKNVSEQDLIDTVTNAFGNGWRSVKLYFMCGLPTETDADVEAIAALAHRVIEVGRRSSGRRDISCTISIGGFVPKPMTPFQWVGQTPAATIDRRIALLRSAIRADRTCGRAISLRYGDGASGVIEGLLARGDRRLSALIAEVWRGGGHFDGWREYFDIDRWRTAAESVGIDIDWYTTRERGAYEVLPWDHLDVGLDRNWLWDDYQAGLQGAAVPDCRWANCNDCGVCPGLGVDIEMAATNG